MDLRFLLLLGCFLLSGFSALLYQTVWTRELSFVFGTSELAVAAVLAAYMGGLALGAAVAARFAPRLRRPVLAYGLLEAGIALSALAVPTAIRGIEALYVAWLGGVPELPRHGADAAALFQVGAAFAVLLVPTAFMGATLPLLARHVVRREQQIGPRVGGLYAVNTAGAIAGALCAAFWLAPEFGLRRTVWFGAALNGVVFVLAALLARHAPLLREETAGRFTPAPGSAWMLPAIAISGAVSFAYEVLWTRLLGHVLGASLEAFATMLASFLLGIALGSAVAARRATDRERARAGFAIAQLGIAVTAYAAFALADPLPQLARRLGAGPEAPLAGAALAVLVLLPTTLCIGATFPFAVRWMARQPADVSGATARVYAWNTLGAIAGALGAGFVLLPELGFEGTVMLGVGASLALAAIAAWAAAPRRSRLAALALVLALGAFLAPARTPWSLLRQSPLRQNANRGELVYAAVGRSSTVILLDKGRRFSLFTNGLPETDIARFDGVDVAPFGHWLGLLPAVVRPDAREMLVVGLGGGVALEAIPPSVERIDVIELEPEVLVANQKIADERARDPLADPRVHVHIGDARGALQLTSKRYGAIVSQPSHPWTAGASHLYTREFFSLARDRLEPGGVFVQWIGPAFVDEALLRSLLSALLEVFEHVEVYAPDRTALIFAASDAPIEGSRGVATQLAAVPERMAGVDVHRVEDFASGWLLDVRGARALADGAEPNTDDENQLASRAARLGDAALSWSSATPLFAPYEPLLAHADGLDRPTLIRGLLRRGYIERAEAVARAGEGAERERGLGWIDLARRRVRSAARHFEAAVALEPGDPDALAGLVATHRVDLARGPLAGLPESALDAPVAALVAGWRLAERGDWSGVAALDAELARIARGHPLYEDATRLRARARLEIGGAAEAIEAVGMLEGLITSLWRPNDALEFSRAAAAAGRPELAWMSLRVLSDRIPRGPRGREFAQRALDVADSLPADPIGGVRERIARRARSSR